VDRESRARCTICRGETMVSYTETIYYLSPRVIDCLFASNPKTYAGSGYGMLCRDFAAHRCYKETLLTLLCFNNIAILVLIMNSLSESLTTNVIALVGIALGALIAFLTVYLQYRQALKKGSTEAETRAVADLRPDSVDNLSNLLVQNFRVLNTYALDKYPFLLTTC
jgi:hypothetical protein